MSQGLVTASYIVAAVLFILSLAGLSKQETAKHGNLFGIAGMAIALLATVFNPETSGVHWIILAMVIGGLGGFGVSNFGGGLTAIGSVGDRDISTDDYARALQSQVQALSQQFGQPISTQEALAFGIDKQVLAGLINRAALDEEAGRIGLSVGDQAVADLAAQYQAGIVGRHQRTDPQAVDVIGRQA